MGCHGEGLRPLLHGACVDEHRLADLIRVIPELRELVDFTGASFRGQPTLEGCRFERTGSSMATFTADDLGTGTGLDRARD